MKKLSGLLFLFSVFIQNILGNNIDSLEALIKTVSDTQKVTLLGQISVEHLRRNSYELAIMRATEAVELAKSSNVPEVNINALNNAGEVYSANNDYEKALFYHGKALTIAYETKLAPYKIQTHAFIALTYLYQEKYNDAIREYNKAVKLGKGQNDVDLKSAYHGIAIANYMLGNYEESLKAYIIELKIKETNNLEKQLPETYLGIGNIYLAKKEFENAISQYQKALQVAEKYNRKEDQAQLLNNIGLVYNQLQKFDLALESLIRSLQLKEESNVDKSELINTIVNIGSVYDRKEDYKKAIEFYERGLKIGEEINHQGAVAMCLSNIGRTYGKQKKFELDIEYQQRALAIFNSIGLKNQLKDIYDELSSVYAMQHDYTNAYRYQTMYMQIKDTLLNEENTRSLHEIQTKYETEKKETEIKLLNSQNESASAQIKSQRIAIVSVIVGLLAVIIFSFFLYKNFKAMRQARNIISEQKKVVEIKNREITDSINYAKRIQNSILPDIKMLNDVFPESFILYLPKDIVSGDFYWFNTHNEHLLLAAADCTGHGVPGALMSMIGSKTLQQISTISVNTRPSYILGDLNDEIRIALHQGIGQTDSRDGMDIALIRYHWEKKLLEYAGANRPLYIISEGELKEIKPDKNAIGGLQTESRVKFTNHDVQVKKGDIVYLFTDGYADQFGGEQNKKITTKKFKQQLLQISSKSMNQQKEELLSFFNSWKDDQEQVDDVLVIGIKIV